MQRIALITMALIGSTGCIDVEDLEFLWGDSPSMTGNTLQTETNGVVIHRNGREAHVGMTGTTCQVDTEDGYISTDHDMPGNDEMVVDTTIEGGQDLVLGTSEEGVHVVVKDDDWADEREDYVVPNTIDAEFSESGIIVLNFDPEEGCAVTWVDRVEDIGSQTVVSIPDQYCDDDAGFTVGPALDIAIVSSPSGDTLTVSLDDIETVGQVGNDLIIWDTDAQLLYAASTGGTVVTATTQSGDEVWTAELNAPIVTLNDAGTRKGAIVLVEVNGNQQVRFLDAEDGDDRLEMEVPGGVVDIAVSDTGDDIALIKADEVYFTRLR